MNNNPASEAYNELADSSVRTIDAVNNAIPYIVDAFHNGYEGQDLVSFTVQSAAGGTYRGFIKSVLNMDEPTESGLIAYTSSDTVDGIFQYFEDALAYGELEQRVDQYHKNSVKHVKNSRQGRSKRKL